MLDLLAAVQSVDPLSVPLWALVVFAAGMYPVGFLFGFACGGCCEQDPCAGGCNYCSGFYALINNDEGPCHDVFDSWEIASPIDSATKINIATNQSEHVDVYTDLTESMTCLAGGTVELSIVIRMWASYFYFQDHSDECGCYSCEYIQRFQMRIWAEVGGGGYYFTSSYAACEWEIAVPFDKCSQSSATATLSLTKQDIESCLANMSISCPFAEDFEGIDLDVTISLDGGCECGACCVEDGAYPPATSCKDNVAESYCLDNGNWYDKGQVGVWMEGVACEDTDCADLQGACCIPGEPCFLAFQDSCENEFGGTHMGVGTDCDPNPCE